MIKKITWTFVLVLVIGVGIGLAVVKPTPVVAPVAEKNTIPGQAENGAIGGPIDTISPSGISIKKQDGTSASFTVTADTKVESVVASGEVGKKLSDLTPGAFVL